MRFLHCSDVHVTANYREIPLRRLGWRRGLALFELSLGGRSAAYQGAGDTLAAIASDVEHHRADHLVVSGDLTAYALDEEFRRAREKLGALAEDPLRCTVIPGNHDVYTPNAHRSRRFERYFGHLLESDLPEYRREGAFPFVRLLGDDSAVVGLLSARVPLMPGFSFGTIGRAQLSGLEALVADARLRHRAVLVVVHHAPLTHLALPDKRLHGLTDARELFRVVRGPRFAVLHGHIHRRYHHPATSERPHLFGAGSSTQAGREGYWLIETRDGLVRGGEMYQPGLVPTA
ncbi:MAG: metallophosphoesterase [Myxococcaceae bacterium]|nr:metallophosphoesterase [Myxococcaceae bacterium]MCI0669242.1 metallophosphoesterase [Myxococcaceae bacterium]